MQQFTYVVNDPLGLHARPAGLLVKEAQKFSSTVKLTRGEKSADLKRLFAIMGMGVKCGETVEVAVDGADEAEAAQTLEKFFQENF